MAWARAQVSISFTAASMWPLAFQSLSNIGDLLGMRMYSTSWGTISSSHLAPMKLAAAAGSRRAMSMETPGNWMWPFYAPAPCGDFLQMNAAFPGTRFGKPAMAAAWPGRQTLATGNSRQEAGPRGPIQTATGSVAMKLFHLSRPLLLSLLRALGAVSAASAADKVNINTADAAQLEAGLVGIGPAKAEAIVAHRKANGPFKSADELALVKGIGLKTIERNRDLITVGTTAAAKPPAGAKAPAAGNTAAKTPAPATPVARR